MRRRVWTLLIASLIVAVTTPTHALVLSYEQLTVTNAAGGVRFTALKVRPNGPGNIPIATLVECNLETAQIRWTVDRNTVPTSTVGTLLEVGKYITIPGTDAIDNFRAIATGSSGSLSCHFYSQ